MNTQTTEPDSTEQPYRLNLPAVLDARFAGGAIVVDVDTLPHAPEQPIVRVQLPGLELALFDHEAADLAAALALAAATIMLADEQSEETGR